MRSARRTRLVFVGDESLVVHCASLASERPDVDVLGVATSSSAVASELEGRGIAVWSTDKLDDLTELSVDVLFSIANERILSPSILGSAPVAINFHDGPLPELAGLGVTTWAIHDDRRTHGVTWHHMTADVDAGAIVLAERFPIADDDTALALNARCFEAGLATFPRVLDSVTGGLDGVLVAPGEPPLRTIGRHERPVVWLDPDRPASDLARDVRSLDVGTRVRNRVGGLRGRFGDRWLVIREATAAGGSGCSPGEIVAIEEGAVRVATVDGDLLIESVDAGSEPRCSAEELASAMGLSVGSRIVAPDGALRVALDAWDGELARHEPRWLSVLSRSGGGPDLPMSEAALSEVGRAVVAEGDDDALFAAVCCWWSLRTGRAEVAIGDGLVVDPGDIAPLVHPPIVDVDMTDWSRTSELVGGIARRRREAGAWGPYLADLPSRLPGLAASGPDVVLRREGTGWSIPPSARVVVDVVEGAEGRALAISARGGLEHGELDVELARVLARFADGIDHRLADVDLLADADRAVLSEINLTSVEHDRGETIDALIRAQADVTPDAPAVSDLRRGITYAELVTLADRFAASLQDVGVGRGDLVGIALDRDVDLVVAVLGTLSAGAAYVPLDPEYPQERLSVMAQDADLAALVATTTVSDRFGLGVPTLHPAVGGGDVARAPNRVHGPDDRAYVIYTSGSTGAPKGVVLEHRNVANFFAAMDDVVDHDEPGTWLAVTSLSFDISVLELLWTLTRGFHVVVHRRTVGAARSTSAVRAPSWSLFFFAAGETQASEGYRLLLESARFADTHGFEAVWVPERHFHEFGAAYPNPSVVAAALAAITDRISIRAGSVVLPLHQTARVAEEWAVVDNLSGGRVGISFAAGWQPRDFVLNPGAYATARTDLAARMDEVRALWRGESVALAGHDGEPVEIVTLPRPVQPELPTWMTSAGNPATFEEAGRLGHNVLTHLLGQSIDQLAANLGVYRAARRAAGHEGDGQVTLMLHTHLDADESVAHERSHEPMRSYLRTATGLIKNMASSFPTFGKAGMDADEAFRSLTDDEMEQLLTVAAARYMETSGLFTTPGGAADLVEQLAAVGVDEVACLVDFGIDTDEVLESLDLLATAKAVVDERLATPTDALVDVEEGVGAVADRFGVTHLQCTPSLAEILLAVPEDRDALGRLRHLMVGGEALNEALAAELRSILPGRLTNMYGPTETTIWSLVHELDQSPHKL